MNFVHLFPNLFTGVLSEIKDEMMKFTVEDLECLDEYDFCCLADSEKKKPLMKILYNRFQNRVKLSPYHDSYKSNDVNMSNRLISSSYGNLKSYKISFDQFVRDASEVSTLEDSSSNPDKIFKRKHCCHIMNLSNNYLNDFDLPHLLQLVKDVYLVDFLVLYGNRFHCYKSSKSLSIFRSIVKNVEKFIIIAGNPFATMDNKDEFFMNMDEDEVRKLIWINKPHIDSTAWKSLVPHEMIADIHQTHKDFYSSDEYKYISSSSNSL